MNKNSIESKNILKKKRILNIAINNAIFLD